MTETEGENLDTTFQLLGFPQVADQSGLQSREPFEVLASQFVEELRHGQRPSIELYARRYPPHAARIRDCFPVLALLEQARIDRELASFRRNMPERFPFSRLGGCELLCELGRGGMGVVFQARDTISGQVVAIKVLPWRGAIVPDFQQRFEREARIASLLRHRNIVPVFRYGQEHGYCYYVMQFVNGVGLDLVIERLRQSDGVVYQDEIRRIEHARPRGFVAADADSPSPGLPQADLTGRRRLTRSSWQSFARIAVQATQALRAAHAAGILHNDIKPANLLLDTDGRVWVTDFGLSQPMLPDPASLPPRESRPQTRSGRGRLPDVSATTAAVAGTLRYMAPECLVGNRDARSDLYSLGITLYELALQRQAFTETDRDRLTAAVRAGTPETPGSIDRTIPGDLETIILNCIAQNPQDRYASADALLSDLIKFCAGDRVFSTRPGTLTGLIRSVRQHLHGLDPDR